MQPEIVPVRSDQCEQLGAVLARAFANDPGTSYSFPDPERRRRCLQWMFSRWIRIMSRRGTAYTTGDLAGVALWIPPGADAGVPTLELLLGGFLAGFLVMTPGEQFRGLRVYRDATARTHRHLEGPHWVLDTLGVDPAHQGHGVAAALIHAATGRCHPFPHTSSPIIPETCRSTSASDLKLWRPVPCATPASLSPL